ncbi:MAG TPA: CsbD family protein [Alphaproteobacteria bacterium]|nr:CsbD family protein [Alphaproteobacteria bacterium]
MNKDIFEGNWKQLKGEVQKQWGKLTNDNLDIINGSREKLSGLIQENYGVAKDEAEKQIKDWEKVYRKAS